MPMTNLTSAATTTDVYDDWSDPPAAGYPSVAEAIRARRARELALEEDDPVNLVARYRDVPVGEFFVVWNGGVFDSTMIARKTSEPRDAPDAVLMMSGNYGECGTPVWPSASERVFYPVPDELKIKAREAAVQFLMAKAKLFGIDV